MQAYCKVICANFYHKTTSLGQITEQEQSVPIHRIKWTVCENISQCVVQVNKYQSFMKTFLVNINCSHKVKLG